MSSVQWVRNTCGEVDDAIPIPVVAPETETRSQAVAPTLAPPSPSARAPSYAAHLPSYV